MTHELEKLQRKGTKPTCPHCHATHFAGKPAAWECMGRKQSLPEPGECNWPDCGCDPHATKVIESLLEQGWTGPAALAATPAVDRETIETLLALLNPLHGDIDKQTYDEKVSLCFDAPRDHEYAVTVTAQQERDLNQAICILESRLRNV